ncbi:DUF362 domain-containing protein [Candidatus Thorarchaeota archaeon]|nr:MAG: DUF362 domain-containing protein [Candidatus Thorarchaeota archaeon]
MQLTTDISVAVKKNPLEALSVAISKLPQPVRFAEGIDEIIIKPSIYDPALPGNTSLGMMMSVVNVFEDIAKLVVVESDNPIRSAESAFHNLGCTTALSERVRFKNLSQDEKVPVDFPGNFFQKHEMPETIENSQFLVNLATLKAEPNICTIGGSVKNLFGLIPEKDKSVYHDAIDDVLQDLLFHYKPDFTILEMTNVVLGKREEKKTKFVGGVVVGEDPVAIDSYCAKLLGFDPFDIPHLLKAHNQGLGQAAVDHINVHGTEHQKTLLEKSLRDCMLPKGI